MEKGTIQTKGLDNSRQLKINHCVKPCVVVCQPVASTKPPSQPVKMDNDALNAALAALAANKQQAVLAGFSYK